MRRMVMDDAIKEPEDLEGKTVAVNALKSMPEKTRAMTTLSGGYPDHRFRNPAPPGLRAISPRYGRRPAAGGSDRGLGEATV
jgi:hypothetical protein